jgi:hypothetical protein
MDLDCSLNSRSRAKTTSIQTAAFFFHFSSGVSQKSEPRDAGCSAENPKPDSIDSTTTSLILSASDPTLSTNVR